MKTAILFLVLIIPVLAFNQEKSIPESGVPSTIKEFVKGNYPAAAKIEYTKEFNANTTYIVAAFLMGKAEMSLKFEDEKLVETEKKLSWENLPGTAKSKITAYLDEKYIKYKITGVSEVTPNGDSFYVIGINCKCSPKESFELSFSTTGELLEAKKQ